MAQSVIDLFESVQVKVGERDRLLATPGAFPLPIGILIESQSVCNASEAVYARQLPLAIMQRLQRCDNQSNGDKEAEQISAFQYATAGWPTCRGDSILAHNVTTALTAQAMVPAFGE